MIERGGLTREQDGPRFVYFPAARPEDASKSALRQLVRTFFDNSPGSAMAALIDITGTSLTPEDPPAEHTVEARPRQRRRTMSSASLIPGLLDVVGLLVKASLWLFAIGVAFVALRNRTSAATRHWMWTLAVAGLLALPLLSGSLPSWTVAIPVTSPAVRADAAPARAVFDDESPLLPVAASPKAANAEASLASVTTATNGLLDRLASSWPVTLVTLYLAGALLLLSPCASTPARAGWRVRPRP